MDYARNLISLEDVHVLLGADFATLSFIRYQNISKEGVNAANQEVMS